MIKKVKQALANGEGCRVGALQLCNFYYEYTVFWMNIVHNMKALIFSVTELGLWGVRCSKSCWKLPYFSSWLEHFCCADGK